MSRPYFKLYGRDFRDGVRPLTLEEVGAYTLLLTLIYDAGGPILDDSEAIRRHLGCDRRVWERLRARLIATGKLTADEGRLSNDRAEREIADGARISEIRSSAGRVGGEISGQARLKSGQSPGKVRAKSGQSPADFSVLARKKPLKHNDCGEAIASKAEPYSEDISSTAPNGAAERSRRRDAALLPNDGIAPAEKFATRPPGPGPQPASPQGPPQAPGQRSQIVEACLAAAGPGLADPAKTPSLHLTAPRIAAAIAAGCDLESDILPVIRARTAKARASPIAVWGYFEPAWLDARNERLRPMPPPPNPESASGFSVIASSKGVRNEFAEPRTYTQIRAERARRHREEVLREFGVIREPRQIVATVVG